MVEVHQLAREADDLLFQQLQPLADVQLARSRPLRGAPARGRPCRSRRSSAAAGACRSRPTRRRRPARPARPGLITGLSDHLQELLVFDVQGVAFGAVEEGGRVGGWAGETCLLNSSNASWHVRRIFSCTRAGQACIFLFIQLQRPSPSTMQTPSPIVLRIRFACWLTRAVRGGGSRPSRRRSASKWSWRRASIAWSIDPIETTSQCSERSCMAAELTVVAPRTSTFRRDSANRDAWVETLLQHYCSAQRAGSQCRGGRTTACLTD